MDTEVCPTKPKDTGATSIRRDRHRPIVDKERGTSVEVGERRGSTESGVVTKVVSTGEETPVRGRRCSRMNPGSTLQGRPVQEDEFVHGDANSRDADGCDDRTDWMVFPPPASLLKHARGGKGSGCGRLASSEAHVLTGEGGGEGVQVRSPLQRRRMSPSNISRYTICLSRLMT